MTSLSTCGTGVGSMCCELMQDMLKPAPEYPRAAPAKGGRFEPHDIQPENTNPGEIFSPASWIRDLD